MSKSGNVTNSQAAMCSEDNATLVKERNVPQVHLCLQNITYAPLCSSTSSRRSSEKKRKTVLSNISTDVVPGQLTAWMGPSGSGKTSLISVAAGLVDSADLMEGSSSMVNGERGSIPKRLVGVVWQDDLLLSNLTVEETIFFSAKLKSPSHFSDEDVKELVNETMSDLGLLGVRDSLIGNPFTGGVRGISGGERKRVSVASELVVRPAVLLLDEPTSGLDSTSAKALILTLKHLAAKGHAITVVIHQPRTAIYNMFDHLLVLSRGHVVFDGKPCDARSHLEGCVGVEALPPETGIADWMMDTISDDETRDIPLLPSHWEAAMQRLDHPKQRQAMSSSLADLRKLPKFETSFWTQLFLLTTRTLKQHRGERLTRVALLVTGAYAFFTALFWGRVPNDTNHVHERNSLLFFILIAQSMQVVTGSMTVFQKERALLRRERAKKMYRVLPYFLAKTLSDMTNSVLLPCLYGTITYWVTDLRPSFEHFAKFIFALYMTLATAQSMGLFLSIAIPSISIALLLAPALTLFFMILGGFYIPLSNVHDGVRWATWVSFAQYGYTAFVVNEFGGRFVPCAQSEVAISIGQTDECPLPGDEVLVSLGMTGVSGEFWFNVAMITTLQVFFRTAAYLLLRKSK